MTYGYCRISTARQSLKRQIDNVRAYDPTAIVYTEVYTGTRTAEIRPEFAKLLKRLRPGYEVVFDEVSRMSRNAEDGFALYKKLFDAGIELTFLKERSLDTRNIRKAQQISYTGTEIADTIIEAVNKVLMILAEEQIRAAFQGAEHEVVALHQRTADGMKAHGAGAKIAKARTGQHYETAKARKAKATILKAAKAFGGPLTDKELIPMLGISRGTFYAYKKELIAAQKAEYDIPVEWAE